MKQEVELERYGSPLLLAYKIGVDFKWQRKKEKRKLVDLRRKEGNSMKKLYLLFAFLFLISFVIAQQPNPPQTNVNINLGLTIDFPKITSIQINKDHEFSFHVFNISDGLRVDNTTTTCIFHLFDFTGEHASDEMVLPFDLGSNDWEITVIAANFSQTGQYSVLVDCNDGGFGGFTSFGFNVTPTGESENMLGLYALLYLILFGIVFFGFYVKNEWIAILGGLGLIFLGIYTLNTGIIIFRNVATEVVAWITIGLGTIIAVVTSISLIEDNL
ncbi:hypothetical protein LCGC14_0990650 [marine sediment metagenome]|uniref:Uncharacterized protein n=1 Tax=marine sediment metagenome TaxID=412755 RepID=A0A0F9N5U3_9ZZZZ